MAGNALLGEFGEQEARNRLERCLLGTGARFQGSSDKGLDLILQFESPNRMDELFHFGVQVKAGDSYVQSRGSRWLVKNISPDRFRQWCRSHLPVLFVWVRPTAPAECYWALIRKDSTLERFSISKGALISPSLRYDLTLGMSRDQTNSVVRGQVLIPPLGLGLRPIAKRHYRALLQQRAALMNPVLGDVRLSWRAWRHMTRQGRPKRYISQSLQLLPNLSEVVSASTQFLGMRRLARVRRGAWVTEVRLLAFRGPTLVFGARPPAEIRVVFRERIRYPLHWAQDVRLHENVSRDVTIESLYEKVR
jgi:hypothetical protein